MLSDELINKIYDVEIQPIPQFYTKEWECKCCLKAIDYRPSIGLLHYPVENPVESYVATYICAECFEKLKPRILEVLKKRAERIENITKEMKLRVMYGRAER